MLTVLTSPARSLSLVEKYGKNVENRVHTVKITGHLTFESKHANFRTAFRDFLEDEESIQLQITDMMDTKNPSMEVGALVKITREINSVIETRFAKADNSRPQRIEPKRPAMPIDPESPSDTCFY